MMQRNAAAVDALELALRPGAAGRPPAGAAAGLVRDSASPPDSVRYAAAQALERVALFYGPLHLEGPSGIVSQVLARWPDARIVDTSWRTAFAAELDSSRSKRESAASQNAGDVIAPERLLLPLYLAIDALDWWLTCADVAANVELSGQLGGPLGDDALALGLYVLRHGLLYWSLSRWALDWSGRFED